MAAARRPWLKPLVFAGAASPLVWLVSRALRGTLGPDPVAEVLNRLGLYAISLLFCSLACTPLQIALGWNWPLRVRRMLGLLACIHFSWRFKTALLQPVLFSLLLAVLLAVRAAKPLAASAYAHSGKAGRLLAKWRGQPPS